MSIELTSMRAFVCVLAVACVATSGADQLFLDHGPSTVEGSLPAHFIGFSIDPHVDGEEASRVWGRKTMEASDLPAAWDWRNVNGISYAARIRNQNNPNYCGSCWGHAAASSMTSRLRIANERWRRDSLELAAQHLVNCVGKSSCHGGSSYSAYAYMHKEGVVDEGCAPYLAVDQQCTPETTCTFCTHIKNPTAPNAPIQSNCTAVTDPPRWHVGSYGRVGGMENMMKEIKANGPIACCVDWNPDVRDNYRGGIYVGPNNDPYPPCQHLVSVVGWGVEGDKPYWIVQHSAGSWWGEDGYLRIGRGTGWNLGIENSCSWALPASQHYDSDL